MIKDVSNNDVADAATDKQQLDMRKRDRQIMSEQPVAIEEMQIVSLKNQMQWTSPPVPSVNPKDTMWDFTACGIPYIWTYYGVRGSGINVFVLDTGIDIYHPTFAHCQDKIVAKSFVSNTQSPADGCGHGTWVCGKIVGGGIGIAPSCNLYSLKVLDDSGTGRIEFTNKALEWILKQDKFPHVINMSLGSSKKNIKQEKLLWQLYKKGACIVVAAGNDGDDDKFYPASYSGVLSVAAVDKKRTRADFSNYGANIAVCAPGVACYSSYMGGGFRLLQGTSMASPTVAGLVALGMSYASLKGASDIRDKIILALEQSADDLGDKGRDPYYGFGCIDGRGFFEKLVCLNNESLEV